MVKLAEILRFLFVNFRTILSKRDRIESDNTSQKMMHVDFGAFLHPTFRPLLTILMFRLQK